MPDPSLALPTLALFALLLGLKHGLDADHLAAIDGLARIQARQDRLLLARLSGTLFSMGHGIVVLGAAFLLQRHGTPELPAWLRTLGTWISIVFLLTIGITNLHNMRATCEKSPAASAPLRWLARSGQRYGLIAGLAIGALFALSLDTVTMAIWFGIAGAVHGGINATAVLTAAFICGMVLTDALNGIMVAFLIARSEAFVDCARRLFSLLLACSALFVAALGVLKFYSGVVDAWSDGKELLFGAGVTVATACGFMIARWQHQRFSAKSIQSLRTMERLSS